jgi:hypothetical protein
MMKNPGRSMDSCLRAESMSAQQTDECLLDIPPRSSAVAIVERHAPDLRNREAPAEAIARPALIGLEGQVRLYAAELKIAACSEQ